MTIVLPIKYKEYNIIYSEHTEQPLLIDESSLTRAEGKLVDMFKHFLMEGSPNGKEQNNSQDPGKVQE